MQKILANPDHQITISIVSHGHGQEVGQLVQQLLDESYIGRVILTLNLPEEFDLPADERLVLRENSEPKGFGANHNAAFKLCSTPYFCVLNPDIVILKGAFGALLSCSQSTQAAVAGPLVISPNGKQEDSWRRFPTLRSLVLKAFGFDTTILEAKDSSAPFFPDWVGGMCMFFTAASFSRVGGFNERFYLYYEDVDICARLWRMGCTVVASPESTMIHNAQRASRHRWEHARWHAVSMLKYFLRYWFRLPTPATKPSSLNEETSV